MRKIFVLAFVFTVFVALLPQTSHAGVIGFQAGRIIDDAVFTNNTSMSVTQIQAFLNAKVPVCDTSGSQMYNSWQTRAQYAATIGQYPPFTCLKDYSESGLGAAQIIYNVAQQYRINPQTLIVLLQKEQGLVTDSWPYASQYQKATGYGCPDTAPCNTAYYGFTNQLTKAANMFRKILDNSPDWYTPYVLGNNYILYNPNTACGGSIVNIENRATQALYNYTPYQPNQAALDAGWGTANCGAYGNRNFYSYFTSWFGPTTSTFLIQSPSSPAVFLQAGYVRYGIPSYDVLRAYGFDKIKVTPVSDAYMTSIPDGGVLGTVFKKEGESAIYLADNGFRFGFSTYQQCVDWGQPSCISDAKSLPDTLFGLVADHGDIKSLMLNGSAIYLLQAGEKLPFLSYKALTERGYSSNDITPITSPLNLSQPIGYSIIENNSFIAFKSNPIIYAYNNGMFYPLTFSAYQGLSSSSTPIVVDNDSKYTTNPPTQNITIPQIVSLSDGKVYLLTNGSKLDITQVSSQWPAATNIEGIRVIVDRKATGATANTSSSFRSVAGSIFNVEGGKVRPYYSLYDYFALGNTSPITVGNEIAQTLPPDTAPILAAGSGSIYQVAATGKEYAIYTLSSDGSICQIRSLNQLGEFGLVTSNVRRIAEITGTTKELSSLIKDSAGTIYLISKGKRIAINTASLATTWGVSSAPVSCSFTPSFISRIPQSQQVFNKFVRDTAGVIYLGENGSKRPILSYNSFLTLGGNSLNTIDVPVELIDAMPTGQPIY